MLSATSAVYSMPDHLTSMHVNTVLFTVLEPVRQNVRCTLFCTEAVITRGTNLLPLGNLGKTLDWGDPSSSYTRKGGSSVASKEDS